MEYVVYAAQIAKIYVAYGPVTKNGFFKSIFSDLCSEESKAKHICIRCIYRPSLWGLYAVGFGR